MSDLEKAIQYIDEKISDVIGLMLDARKKHLDALNTYLTKLKTIQSQASATLSYRHGYTFDRMVKVETPTLQQIDVKRPKIKLSYTGDKMSLSYNTESIQVPSVPIFLFDLKPPPKNVHDIGIGALHRNMLLQLPTNVSPVEAPDVENSFGKYYFLPIVAHVYEENSKTFTTPWRIAQPLPIMSITSISWKDFYSLVRTLHIGGYSYDFCMYIRPCVITYNQIELDGSAQTDLKTNGIYISCVTQYQDEHYWVVYNNRFPKGALENQYLVRHIVMVDFQNLVLVRSYEG
jgi:hypothetical protein